MTYQFIHIETYSRKASTKQKPTKGKQKKDVEAKRNAREIIDEAIRREGKCPHVEAPEAPRFIVGNMETMENMEADIERNILAHHAKHGGRKLRSDAHVLLAGVVSVNREWADENPDLYKKWEADSVQYLQKKYGKNLRAVLMHDDEPNPHLHFYVYSEDEIDAKELHEGHKAMRQHKAMTKEAVIAHADAMRAFQSDYYEQVAHGVGLTRIGPGRERLSRKDWKQSKRVELERVRLTKAADDATHDMLANAADEEKKAVDIRRQLQNERTRVLSQLDNNIAHKKILLDEAKRQKAQGDKLRELEEELRKKAEHVAKATANLVEIPIPVIPKHIDPVVEYQPDYWSALDDAEAHQRKQQLNRSTNSNDGFSLG